MANHAKGTILQPFVLVLEKLEVRIIVVTRCGHCTASRSRIFLLQSGVKGLRRVDG